MSKPLKWLLIAVLLAILVIIREKTGFISPSAAGEDYGFWSVVPVEVSVVIVSVKEL